MCDPNKTASETIVISAGIPPTLFFEDLGLRTYATLLNAKLKKEGLD
jgi:hypothetical protein